MILERGVKGQHFHFGFMCVLFSLSSDDDLEGVIPIEKLVALCKYEPVRLWMRSCDHILYQSLVEILIPDVLRPVPSQYCCCVCFILYVLYLFYS